jgi:hypothetical protein
MRALSLNLLAQHGDWPARCQARRQGLARVVGGDFNAEPDLNRGRRIDYGVVADLDVPGAG